MPKPTEPAWLLKVFATALDKDNAAVLSNMAAAAMNKEFDGGILVERAYGLSDIAAVMQDHDATNVVIVPPSEVIIMSSTDVPNGRIHHVMHFMDGDNRVFSRLYTEPLMEARGRGGM